MHSVREDFSVPAPSIVLPPRDPTIGLSVPAKNKKPTEMPVLQKLDLNKKSPFSFETMTRPAVVLPPKDPTIGKLKSPFSFETMTRPAVVLPPKDPTIGLDLVEECKIPKEELKMLFLPQKIDFAKINEYFLNEDVKIINKNKPKEKVQSKPGQQNFLCPSPNPKKGCRKALFKPSRNSVRKSFRSNKTSILGRKSTKSMKTVNESLLDSSLVEKKIFNSKASGTFKFKSPYAVHKNVSKLQIKPSIIPLKKNEIPKNLDKKAAPTTSAKRKSVSSKKNEKPCTESITNYLKEIKNLLAVDKECLENLSKDLDAFKKVHEDRFVKVEELLKKIEFISCKCKNGANSEPTITTNDENHTPKRSTGRVEILRVSTLKKKVQFDANVKALNLYNSIREDCYLMLSTPKITRMGILVESSATKDPNKIISKKIEQQCLMLGYACEDINFLSN